MGNDILVTVGIPIYNAEKYLDECLESVTAQTYKNIEIILVNDGSTDSSLNICEKWSNKDDRIKIINKKNRGVGMARNSAIDIAKGDYIAFVDADDIISSFYIEILLKLCLEYNSEISYCGMVDCFNDIKSSKVYIENNKYDMNKLSYEGIDVNDNITALDNMFELWILPNICGKLIKTELFKNIRFPLGQRAEDLAVNYKLVYEAKHIAGIKKLNLYYYRKGHASAMTKISSKMWIDFEFRTKEYNFLRKIGCVKALRNLKKQTMRLFFSMLFYKKRDIEDYKEFNKELYKVSCILADNMFYDEKKSYVEKFILKKNAYVWKYYKIFQNKINKKIGKETMY